LSQKGAKVMFILVSIRLFQIELLIAWCKLLEGFRFQKDDFYNKAGGRKFDQEKKAVLHVDTQESKRSCVFWLLGEGKKFVWSVLNKKELRSKLEAEFGLDWHAVQDGKIIQVEELRAE
jgi:hypothetical protein